MLDKRCRHKVRELQQFYLFRKHGYYFYAYYPQHNVTRSTGSLEIQEAYKRAWDIIGELTSKQNVQLYLPFDDKKRQRDLQRVLQLIDQSKPLTSSAIRKLQNELLNQGLSGKSINNYIYILRKAYTGTFPEWNSVGHVATYRKCLPVTSLYGFYHKIGNDRLLNLAFFAMCTGVRVGEIKKCYPIDYNGRRYLQIDGTKTANAVRRVPLIPEAEEAFNRIQGGFRSSAFKESVIKSASICGFNADYVEANHIVFHSWRKVYKTLLESCNVSNNYTEYLMGHSQTNSVNRLYFIADAMDDSEFYTQVVNALNRLL